VNRTAAEEGGSTECLYRTEQQRREVSSTVCVTVQNSNKRRGDLRMKRIIQGKEDRAASEKALQGDRPAEKGRKLSALTEQQPGGRSSTVDRAAGRAL
jgi:hypothetical protein